MNRQLKPEGWQPPNLEAIIRWQQRDNLAWLSDLKDQQTWVTITNGFHSENGAWVEYPTLVGTIQEVSPQTSDHLWIVLYTGPDNYIRVGIDAFTEVGVRDAQ